MKSASKLLFFIMIISCALALPSRADSEKRIAFVVGNAAYQEGPLSAPANDAGLIAQTLQAAGFDVAGARDLDAESLRAAFRDFLDKAQASGPGTVAFVYLSGYGVQLDGENYFVPIDAKIAAAPDVPVEALRLSDYAKRLAGLPLKASFIVLDAARANPFAKSGQPLASGLALVDAEPNMLVAFNAAPGTVAPAENDSYGPYARALVEMIREGGLTPSEVFDGVRLRVNEATKGAQVPWDVSRISAPFVFFERAADAPPPAFAANRITAMHSRPLRDLGAQDAYAAAIERDSLQGYEDFVGAYPSDPMASRVRALLAARREAITWRRTWHVNAPDAYWSYLKRYPRGPHSAEARRRLTTLAAAEEPPPSFAPIAYDVPPPPPAEIVYVDRPVLVLNDPVFGFVPPPPIVFLAPPPAYLVFPPPPPPIDVFVLPVPVFVPVPLWANPPRYVAPPPNNLVYTNIHNTTIINNTTINRGGPNPVRGPGALPGVAAGGVAGGPGTAALATHVALPPSVARKATMIGGPNGAAPGNRGEPVAVPPSGQPGTPLGKPGGPPAKGMPPGHALLGAPGKPLPGTAATPIQPGAPPGKLGVPPGHELPGTAGKLAPGTATTPDQPGTPSASQPKGKPARGAPTTIGKTKPGNETPPDTAGEPSGKPGAAPSAGPSGKAPGRPGHGAASKPAPGTADKHHVPPRQLGAPSQDGPPAAHDVSSGQKPPSAHGSHEGSRIKPARVSPGDLALPGGQPPGKMPSGGEPFTKSLAPPSGPKASVPGSNPALAPRPHQFQQGSRPPQQTYQPPGMPQQSQQPRPPQQTFVPGHPAQPGQQARPAQKQSGCGQPGLPPCH